MRTFINIILSWLWWRASPAVAIETPRKRNHLPIEISQQHYEYSCVPACLSSVFGYFGRGGLSHSDAIDLTDCDQDGAFLEAIPKAMKGLCGTGSRTLRSLASVRSAVRAGCPVVSNDSLSYQNDHAILIVGVTKAGFYIGDPNTASIRWRPEKWLRRAASEFIAILPPPARLQPIQAAEK